MRVLSTNYLWAWRAQPSGFGLVVPTLATLLFAFGQSVLCPVLVAVQSVPVHVAHSVVLWLLFNLSSRPVLVAIQSVLVLSPPGPLS